MKNKQGGKKHKRAKNVQIDNKVDIPTEGQYFGRANKMLGSGRVSLDYFKKNESNEWVMIQTFGVIRGNMRRRMYVNSGDIVLVAPRDFEKSKVDILYKYNAYQLNYLKKFVEIPNIDCSTNEDIEFDVDIEEEENSTYVKKNNSINYSNVYDGLDSTDTNIKNEEEHTELDELGNTI